VSCEVTLLDTLVKLSKIATPIVLALAGWFTTQAINKRSHVTKLKSELHLEWSKKFIHKCFEYSDLLTLIQMGIFSYAETSKKLNELKRNDSTNLEFKNEKINFNKQAANLRSYTDDIRKLKYEIELYAKFVDGSKSCMQAVNKSFDAAGVNYAELKKPESKIDFETTKKHQANLLTELKELQNKVLDI